MHLKNSCNQNKQEKYNNSPKQHPRLCILNPEHNFIYNHSNNEDFNDVCHMYIRKIPAVYIVFKKSAKP